MIKMAPLKGSLMTAGIAGGIVSYYIMKSTPSPTLRDLMVSTILLCIIIIIASLISMTYGPVVDYDQNRRKHSLRHFNATGSKEEELPEPPMDIEEEPTKKTSARKTAKKATKKKKVKKKTVKKKSSKKKAVKKKRTKK